MNESLTAPLLDEVVQLPKRKIHKTPRLLMIDAYTLGSNEFESDKAKEKSTYYVTFRKILESISTGPFKTGDNRIVFTGLQRILDYLFYEPVTHEEIDATKAFVQHLKVTSNGLEEYTFPEEMWRRVVDEFNGRPPIQIRAVKEGSVVYPNEPVIEITSQVDGMGVLAAWFESKLLQVWAPTEYGTQLQHWLAYWRELIEHVYGDTIPKETVDFLASLMLHNFGDRAAICPQESEWLGETALYSFPGTDTLAGAYQAWENSGRKPGVAVTVKALAHRNVQSFETQGGCFRALYDSMKPGDIASFVADCYDYWTACEGDGTGTDDSLLALALESKRTGNGKVVVARPDSGIAVEQVLWVCRLALKHGLYTEEVINGRTWRLGTTLKFIEGDGMTWEEMKAINKALLEQGFLPWAWGLYGVGGGLRNKIARDNTSAKYALDAVGNEQRPVVKFSETLGKTTLPGPFKLLRSKDALDAKKTIAFADEEGEDALIEYFNGLRKFKPFGIGQDDDFNDIKERQAEQMRSMPLTLSTARNHNYPATAKVKAVRIQLLKKYAPKKLAQNYE
jgi:nicotinamide phosphoribosyltransferase